MPAGLQLHLHPQTVNPKIEIDPKMTKTDAFENKQKTVKFLNKVMNYFRELKIISVDEKNADLKPREVNTKPVPTKQEKQLKVDADFKVDQQAIQVSFEQLQPVKAKTVADANTQLASIKNAMMILKKKGIDTTEDEMSVLKSMG